MNEKQRARIEDWQVVGYIPYRQLVGRINSHPHQREFKKELQVTSRLIRLEEKEGWAETENTIYDLGKKGES